MNHRRTSRGIALLLMASVLPVGAGAAGAAEKAQPVPFEFPDLRAPAFPDRVFDIRDFGAKPGGASAVNTRAIAGAIDACHRAGGGKVLIPQGIWTTGPVHLKSRVNLRLDPGAELRFSRAFADYLPVVLTQRACMLCYNYSPLIYARGCEDVAVSGKGVLNGQGDAWWPWKNRQPGMVELIRMGKSGVPVEKRVFGTEEAGVRPCFIQFLECKNVLLEGFTLRDSPSWNVHPVFCENVIIRGVQIHSLGPNNDGIDPDSCKNVLIEDCRLATGDNAIALKAGRDEEAWRTGRPLENVIIRRCTVHQGGGIAIGSEMSAGVRNVLVEDCRFAGSGVGLRFKSRVGRGGVVENYWARKITMQNIRREAVNVDLRYDGEPIERAMNYQESHAGLDHAPTFRDLHFEDITCDGAGAAVFLRGLPGGSLSNLSFKNVAIQARKGLSCEAVDGLRLENVNIQTRTP